MNKKLNYGTKHCLICDSVFFPKSGIQKFCIKCRKVKFLKDRRRYSRSYYENHKASIKERKHRWYMANWNKIRTHQKEYVKAKKLKAENKK